MSNEYWEITTSDNTGNTYTGNYTYTTNNDLYIYPTDGGDYTIDIGYGDIVWPNATWPGILFPKEEYVLDNGAAIKKCPKCNNWEFVDRLVERRHPTGTGTWNVCRKCDSFKIIKDKDGNKEKPDLDILEFNKRGQIILKKEISEKLTDETKDELAKALDKFMGL